MVVARQTMEVYPCKVFLKSWKRSLIVRSVKASVPSSNPERSKTL